MKFKGTCGRLLRNSYDPYIIGLLLADLAFEIGLICEPVDLDELLAGSVCLSPVGAVAPQASLDVQLRNGTDWDRVGEIEMLLR